MTDQQIPQHMGKGRRSFFSNLPTLVRSVLAFSGRPRKRFQRAIASVQFLLLIGTTGCMASGNVSLRQSEDNKTQETDVDSDTILKSELHSSIEATSSEDQAESTEQNDGSAFGGDRSGGDRNSTFALPPTSPTDTRQFSESITLEGIIAAAVTSHPGIEAARQRVAAASNKVAQAGALPDPVLANGFWPNRKYSPQTASGRVGNTVALMQRVPWPEKLDTEEAVATHEVEIAQAELDDVVQDIEEAAALAYYELWLIQETIRIVNVNRELLNNLIGVSAARYRAGGTQQDVVRAELEADKLEDQLIALRLKKEEALAEIGTLVRKPLQFQAGDLTEPQIENSPLDLETLAKTTVRCNPKLRMLVAETLRDRDRRRLATLRSYPDFDFGLNWSRIDDEQDVLSPVADGRDSVGISVAVTLPIWREKIDSGIDEAAHMLRRTVARREMESDRLRGKLRRFIATAEALREQESLLDEKLIPRTQQNLELATSDYRGERGDFLGVIDVYQELLSHELQLARTKAALAGTIAQIKRTVGC